MHIFTFELLLTSLVDPKKIKKYFEQNVNFK